jgi:hypothetical protein
VNIRTLLAAFLFLFISAEEKAAYAVDSLPSRQELIDLCMARYERSKPKAYETECFAYGNKTECKSKESSYGYDTYAVHLAGECAEEARVKMEAIATQKIRQSWPDISSSFSHAESVPKGKKIKWGSPSNQIFGTVETMREGKNSKGQVCMQLKVNAYMASEVRTEIITACLTRKGWDIVE